MAQKVRKVVRTTKTEMMILLDRQHPCRTVHATHIGGAEKLTLLWRQQDGGDSLGIPYSHIDVPSDESLRHRVLQESIQNDCVRIRQSDQSTPNEHGALR